MSVKKPLNSLEITADGPVTVAAFMARALSRYYGESESIGGEGDFTTAPEISQMFGEIVAAWLMEKWVQAGRPSPVHLVELGPGRGTLMADMLRVMQSLPDLAQAVQVHLVEQSPRLKDIQRQKLEKYSPVWHDHIDSVPEGYSLMVANEFFDALPIHQFEKTVAGWMERVVRAKDDGLVFDTAPPGVDIGSVMPPAFLEVPTGSIFEICPVGAGIIENVAQRIGTHGGAALVIDYGHTQTGLGETLQAVSRHRFSPVLENVGMQDITAHVDFELLARAAAPHATVYGPVTQGAFLTQMGIVQRAGALSAKATPAQKRDIETALYRLTSAKEMGALFKVMGVVCEQGD